MKRPGFHVQQLQHSSRGAAAGGGVGLGRGFWWGPGTKAPVSPVHACASKQTDSISVSIFLSLSVLRPLLGRGEHLVSTVSA